MSDSIDPIHTVTVTVAGRYPDGRQDEASVTVNGGGDIDHMLMVFRAALVAAGFPEEVAVNLDIKT